MHKYEIIENIRTHAKAGRDEVISQIIKDYLKTIDWESNTTRQIAEILCWYNIPIYNFLIKYNEINKNTLSRIQLLIATYYDEIGDYDKATYEASDFLSKIFKISTLERIYITRTLDNYAAIAYLLKSSAYTHCGAITYSRALLHKALKYTHISSGTKNAIVEKLEYLDKIVLSEESRKMNHKWENIEKYYSFIADHCKRMNCPILAREIG